MTDSLDLYLERLEATEPKSINRYLRKRMGSVDSATMERLALTRTMRFFDGKKVGEEIEKVKEQERTHRLAYAQRSLEELAKEVPDAESAKLLLDFMLVAYMDEKEDKKRLMVEDDFTREYGLLVAGAQAMGYDLRGGTGRFTADYADLNIYRGVEQIANKLEENKEKVTGLVLALKKRFPSTYQAFKQLEKEW